MGRGEAAPQGGRAGNLYVILRVQPDERFERDGADLHTEMAVSFPQLALGDRVTVATVDGEDSAGDPGGLAGRIRPSRCPAVACRASTAAARAT